MDIWSRKKRSEVMSRILGSNTTPELAVRRILSRLGYRFRLHSKSLPGRPDIVLAKYQAAIFVHGCFWHFHQGCRDGRIPDSRKKFWSAKLLKNKQRDRQNVIDLRKLGWKVLIFWECEIEKKPHSVETKLIKHLVKRG